MLGLLVTCLLIVLARITDISLDTVRTVAIVQGRRVFAAILGFAEALIYIVAVAQVLQNFHASAYAAAYAAAYAGGFALGTFLGITIDQYLALGEQLVAVFTRHSEEMVGVLRGEGYRVTEFAGRGRDGHVAVLYIKVPRRRTEELTRRARDLDPECFYMVNDVRASSAARTAAQVMTAA